MRQVETCDFCGDSARGLYEPLPDSVGESPRFALCDDCRDLLSSAVDPLLSALEGGSAGRRRRQRTAEGGRSSGSADREARDGSASAGGSSGDDVGGSRDASGREKSDRAGTPPGYRKVMRFLENRALPVDRLEAETLAADAYDLEEDVVAAAIDHAVQYGRLRQVDGELKR